MAFNELDRSTPLLLLRAELPGVNRLVSGDEKEETFPGEKDLPPLLLLSGESVWWLWAIYLEDIDIVVDDDDDLTGDTLRGLMVDDDDEFGRRVGVLGDERSFSLGWLDRFVTDSFWAKTLSLSLVNHDTATLRSLLLLLPFSRFFLLFLSGVVVVIVLALLDFSGVVEADLLLFVGVLTPFLPLPLVAAVVVSSPVLRRDMRRRPFSG